MITIRCRTLFDITPTNIRNRRPPHGVTADEAYRFQKLQQKQSNYDTLLQVISLRSQPEQISDVQLDLEPFQEDHDFGYMYSLDQKTSDLSQVNSWSFTFTIAHAAVFNTAEGELGGLYDCCEGVPMITRLDEWDKIPAFLDTSEELRNIYFEIINRA
jgi:hypothetical protein